MATKNKIMKIVAWGAVFLLLVSPVFVLAQPNSQNPTPGGLVPCDGPFDPNLEGPQRPCDFDAAVRLVQNIMNWLVYIGVYVAGAMFVYAGVLYLTAGANPGNVGRAKKIFINTAWGFAIMLGAWLIVYTIVKAFFNTSDYEFLKLLGK